MDKGGKGRGKGKMEGGRKASGCDYGSKQESMFAYVGSVCVSVSVCVCVGLVVYCARTPYGWRKKKRDHQLGRQQKENKDQQSGDKQCHLVSPRF